MTLKKYIHSFSSQAVKNLNLTCFIISLKMIETAVKPSLTLPVTYTSDLMTSQPVTPKLLTLRSACKHKKTQPSLERILTMISVDLSPCLPPLPLSFSHVWCKPSPWAHCMFKESKNSCWFLEYGNNQRDIIYASLIVMSESSMTGPEKYETCNDDLSLVEQISKDSQ